MGKGDKHKYDPLMGQLQPLIDTQKEISGKAGSAGLDVVTKAGDNYDYVTKFFKNIMEGAPDSDLMRFFNSDEVTKNADENAQQLSEFGVRGSRRAATLGQSAFDRDSAINRVLTQIRATAPDKIAQLTQALGNLGLGELSSSVGAGAQASNTLFGVEGLKQADADRRAALLGSIFEAVGGVAGAVACWSTHGSHIYVPHGKIAASLIKVGDEVLSFNKETKEKVIRKVIRIRNTARQITKIITNGSTIIRPTPTHEFYDSEFKEVLCANVETDDLLTIASLNGGIRLIDRPITIMGEETNDVMIVKLDDENENYPLIVNGYLCLDDDPLVVKGEN